MANINDVLQKLRAKARPDQIEGMARYGMTADIHRIDPKSARWIASDALRELQSDPVQKKLDR